MSVIPRPASTVVLMDEDSRVYLTKRPMTMKFMGGFYVFPGGKVDKSDYVHVGKHIYKGDLAESFEDAHYIAAARELFEEVGVLLCTAKDGTPIQMNQKGLQEYRQLLLRKKISFLDMLKQEKLVFDFQALTYFGHRTTPKESPIRFTTRFFLANLPEGQSPQPDESEVDAADWYLPEDALSACQAGKISLPRPTKIALQTLLNHQQGEPLMMPERINEKTP